ncbi:MAG: SDR family NAD(P)-dependent oxidoreductase [Prolixibacteraceae bacterium]|nr:SDR family NAD(P)-dependent oxidoreductase [Prolixibacteraceae bacterium]
MMDADKKILITGTSSGLGFGLAKKYLEKGCTVFGISRRENKELNSFTNFHFLKQDLSRYDEASKAIFEFTEGIENLDVVILNAGVLNRLKDVRETSIDEFKRVMDVNVWANKMVVDTLTEKVKNIGQIIGISSGSSQGAARGWNAYSISKASLNLLLNHYALELPHIHFCALAPGLIDTAMQDYLFTITDLDKFPAVKKLQDAKRSGIMPDIHQGAEIVTKAISRLTKYESGSYVDVRTMD